MQLSNSLLMRDTQFNIFTGAVWFGDKNCTVALTLFSYNNYAALHLYIQMTSLQSFRNIIH